MKKINCILCNSSDKKIIAKQRFKDEYLSLIEPELNKLERAWVECTDCQLIYHNPQLEEFETEILYQKFRDNTFRGEVPEEYFNRITSFPKTSSENQSKVDWLTNNIPDHLNKGGDILDIGTGGGVFLYSFFQRNSSWSLFGVEPTPEFADLARSKLNCAIHTGNYNKDTYDKKFNLITCNHVLEHTIDPIDFINNIFNDLNPGGYAYIEVPDPIDFTQLAPKHDRFLAQHQWYFKKPFLDRVFKNTGFKVISIESQKTYRGRNNLVSLLFKE